jgi:hypothetical protein
MAYAPQEFDGKLNFATDCWTSPNHRAFAAVTVHLEHDGKPLSMLLDIVEIAKSHTGITLAEEFARILEEFDVASKVSVLLCEHGLRAHEVHLGALGHYL